MHPVFNAIQNGKRADVEYYLNNGGNVDLKNSDSMTPLLTAVASNQPEIVQLLLENGATGIRNALLQVIQGTTDPAIPLMLIKKIAVTERYIETTAEESADIIFYKLLTTVLNKLGRYDWSSSKCCVDIRHFIGYIKPEFHDKDAAFFNPYLTKVETDTGTFYGSYESDDSDSDDEMELDRLDPETYNRILNQTSEYCRRAQVDKLQYQRKSGNHQKGDLKNIEHASRTFDLAERTRIYYSRINNMEKVKQDLEALNTLLMANKSIPDALTELNNRNSKFTKFFVAQYRGIAYSTRGWGQSARRRHRNDKSEIGKPQYSASVLAASGSNMFRPFNGSHADKTTSSGNITTHPIPYIPPLDNGIQRSRINDMDPTDKPRDVEGVNKTQGNTEANAEELERNAQLLREILLCLREPKAYAYQGYSYSNLAYLLQNIYSQDYDGFHHLIQNHPVLQHMLLNGKNPFISMGDTPYHAEKYSFGIKIYENHKEYRLRPRWQSDGHPERPHSGVVYASLHPLTDFTHEGPLHVVSLNREAEIKLNKELMIVPERESCYPALLPANRVFDKQKAKYPSFHKRYKKSYFIKYGIKEPIYEKLREKLQNSRPHSKDRRAFKVLLGEWLCSYNEVIMIDGARQEAEKRGGVLIYRGLNGLFSLEPPIDSVNRNSRAIDPENKAKIKKKQDERKQASSRINKNEITILNNTIYDMVRPKYHCEFGADIYIVDNSRTSMSLSLMMSAVSHGYHQALAHFLSKDIFRACINERFNTDHLNNASLLHLAVLNNDKTAAERLLAMDNLEPNATADQTTEYNRYNFCYFESITSLQLAVMEGNLEMVELLLRHPRVNKDIRCSFVANKNLLAEAPFLNNLIYDDNGSVIGELFPTDPGYDNEILGYSSKDSEIWRCCDNTLLHLAVERGHNKIVKKLIKDGFDINTPNSDGVTPNHKMLDTRNRPGNLQNNNARSIFSPPPVSEELLSDQMDISLKI